MIHQQKMRSKSSASYFTTGTSSTKGYCSKKITHHARRDLAKNAMQEFGLSERHACQDLQLRTYLT